VNVGEELAEARRQSGLTVTQVSQRTRIRETIIRGIEHDDYTGCGGDFYARGHVRAIARAVGTDPGPLIREYDASHPRGKPVSTADIFRSARPIAIPEPRRPHRGLAALLLVVVLGLGGYAAYHFLAGTGHPARGTAAGHSQRGSAAAAGLSGASTAPASPGPAGSGQASPGESAGPPAAPYAHRIAVGLTARQNCWVGFYTRQGRFLFQSYAVPGTTKAWSFRHPVDMRIGNPGGIRLTVDGKRLHPGTAGPVTLHLGLHGNISA
jgi:cytoskeletal protein RodZ